MGLCDINRISNSSLNSTEALFHEHVNRNFIHQVGQVHTHAHAHTHYSSGRQRQISVSSSNSLHDPAAKQGEELMDSIIVEGM